MVRNMGFLLVGLFLAQGAAAENDSPGCQAAREFSRLASAYHDIHDDRESREVRQQLQGLKLVACVGATPSGGLYYRNGKPATHFPASSGVPWYWPNLTVATNFSRQKGAPWYWPNGKPVTQFAYTLGAIWYWPGGQVVTRSAGQKGASYYSPNGTLVVSSGPELKDGDGNLDTEAFLELLEGLIALE